jgi:hypothetical protein
MNFRFYLPGRLQGQPSFYQVATGTSSEGRNVNLTTHLQLVASSRKHGSIQPLHHSSSWRSAELSTGTNLLFYLTKPTKSLFCTTIGKCVITSLIIKLLGNDCEINGNTSGAARQQIITSRQRDTTIMEAQQKTFQQFILNPFLFLTFINRFSKFLFRNEKEKNSN